MVKVFAAGLLCALVLGCATPPAPSVASPAASAAGDTIADLEAALASSGITVVATTDTPSNESSCVPGAPAQTVTLFQEPPEASYDPEKLPLEVLVFASPVERRAYEARISDDGSTISGPGCTAISDYVATAHWYGAGRYLVLLVSDDSTTIAAVAAAATRLGAP